ncbi:MAG: thiamine phosphate synthase [Piscirickettsiaceae bacterium]|nr:thiamine phosphate synthase [Piscirickettsiaceae bacterium]
MALPRRYSITSNEDDLDVIAKMVFGRKDGELSQVRAKMYTLTIIREVLTPNICGIFLLNSSSYDGTTLYPFQGIHLTLQDAKDVILIKEIRSHGVKYIAASCHNEEEIAVANRVRCDFITISPVETAGCHLDVRPIGWQQFSKLSALANMPVFALGGQSIDNLSIARKFGAYGISGMSEFW